MDPTTAVPDLPNAQKQRRFPRLTTGDQLAALALLVWRRPQIRVVTIEDGTYFQFKVPSLDDIRKVKPRLGLEGVKWERELRRSYRQLVSGKREAHDHVSNLLRRAFMGAMKAVIDLNRGSERDLYDGFVRKSLKNFATASENQTGPRVPLRKVWRMARRYDQLLPQIREYRKLSMGAISAGTEARKREIERFLGSGKLKSAICAIRPGFKWSSKLKDAPWKDLKNQELALSFLQSELEQEISLRALLKYIGIGRRINKRLQHPS